MRHLHFGIAFCLLSTMAASASAQAIQLPTFHYTTVNTTVSVPVSGRGFAASAHVGQMSSATQGIPGLAGKVLPNSSLASGAASSGVGISATVTDHDELDRTVLDRAARQTSANGEDLLILRKANKISRGLQSREAASDNQQSAPPLLSVAEIERRNNVADAQQRSEIETLLHKGKAAEAAGKRNLARIYYGMVSRQGEGSLKKEALQRLAEFAKP